MLKVSSKSKPNSVAGAIAHALKTTEKIEAQAVGAGAINQLMKACAIASGFLAPIGYKVVVQPTFNLIDINGEEVTSLLFIITRVK